VPLPAAPPVLSEAYSALRRRFDDFRQALERRDEAAYRVALSDFLKNLRQWTAAVELTLVPALGKIAQPGRDLSRELRLDFVQLRELSRHILEQIEARARLSDVLGLVENLDRRFAAHGLQIAQVYSAAAAESLDESGWTALRAAMPPA
jgi:hypothetical protein